MGSMDGERDFQGLLARSARDAAYAASMRQVLEYHIVPGVALLPADLAALASAADARLPTLLAGQDLGVSATRWGNPGEGCCNCRERSGAPQPPPLHYRRPSLPAARGRRPIGGDACACRPGHWPPQRAAGAGRARGRRHCAAH